MYAKISPTWRTRCFASHYDQGDRASKDIQSFCSFWGRSVIVLWYFRKMVPIIGVFEAYITLGGRIKNSIIIYIEETLLRILLFWDILPLTYWSRRKQLRLESKTKDSWLAGITITYLRCWQVNNFNAFALCSPNLVHMSGWGKRKLYRIHPNAIVMLDFFLWWTFISSFNFITWI